ASTSAAAGRAADPAVDEALNRVSRRILQYFDRAQRIVSTETVVQQPLGYGLAVEGPPRRVVFEVRVERDAAATPGDIPEPHTARRLLTVNGSVPPPTDEPACADRAV